MIIIWQLGQHVDDEPNNYKQTHLILDPSISIILRVNADNKNLSKHEHCSSLQVRQDRYVNDSSFDKYAYYGY